MVFRALEIWAQKIIERSHSDGDRVDNYVAGVSVVYVFMFALIFTLLSNKIGVEKPQHLNRPDLEQAATIL